MAQASSKTKVLTDHDEIREWAEDRGAQPAHVKGTGGAGDIGILRFEFPGQPNAHDEKLEPIDWDQFFEKFDERGLALLVQETTASGEISNFNKLVSRETAESEGEAGTKKHTASKSASTAAKSSKTGSASAAKKSTKKAAQTKRASTNTRTRAAG